MSKEPVEALYDLAAEFEGMADVQATGTAAIPSPVTKGPEQGSHQELRARLDRSMDGLRARFDAAQRRPSAEAVAALRTAADDLMRACARVLLELETVPLVRTEH